MLKRTILAVASLVALGHGGWHGAFAQVADVKQAIAAAEKLFADGDARSAYIAMSSAVQQYPDDAEARLALARLQLELGNGGSAEKEIRKAMELGVAPGRGWAILVEAILLQGQMDRVIDESYMMPLDASLEDRADILGMRGYAEVVGYQWSRAEKTLRGALSMKSDSLPALLGMALLHGRRGEYEETRRWIDRALAKSPESADAWALLGDLGMATGTFDEAEKAYSNAARHRKYTGLEHLRRALALAQLERYQEAEEELAELGRAGLDRSGYARYVAGRVYFAQKRYSDAVRAFEDGYNSTPAFLANRLYLALAHLLLAQPEQALVHAQFFSARALGTVSTTRSDDGIRVVQRASILESDASQYPAARAVLLKALDQAPDEATIFRLLATIAVLEGDEAAGAKYAARLLELEPNAPDSRNLAGLFPPSNGPVAEVDDYGRGVLKVLTALQENRPGDAQAGARELAVRYPDKAEPLNLEAAIHLKAAQWGAGKVLLERSLALEPRQPDVVINLAKVELQTGNPLRARDLLNGLDRQFLGAEGTLLLYRIEKQLGNESEGLALLDATLQEHPEATGIRLQRTESAMEKGDFAKVLELTEGLNDTEMEGAPRLLELRGRAQASVGDAQQALDTYQRWVKLRPESAPAHFYLADALSRNGKADEAASAINRASELDPAYLPARIGMVKSLVQRGELDQARARIAALKSDFGEDPQVLAIEGWFALGTSDFETASRTLSRSLELRSDSETTQLLVRALWAQEAHELAIEAMNRRLASDPRDLAVLMQLAGAYLTLERQVDARSVYAQVVDAYPNHVPALNNLAWLSREHDPDQALAYARRAQTLLPTDPYVLDTLGNLLVSRRELDEAIETLRRAANALPDSPEIGLHLGQALAEGGRGAEARDVLNRLVERNPDGAEVEQAKALLGRLSAASEH